MEGLFSATQLSEAFTALTKKSAERATFLVNIIILVSTSTHFVVDSRSWRL